MQNANTLSTDWGDHHLTTYNYIGDRTNISLRFVHCVTLIMFIVI